MTQRERFRAFMTGAGDERFLPFPITKTAFAAGTLGRRWATEVSVAEIRDALLAVGCVPAVILGEKEWFPAGHPLSLSPALESESGGMRRYLAAVETPHGKLEVRLAESERQSLTLVSGPGTDTSALRRMLWYVAEVRSHLPAITERVAAVRKEAGPDCLVQVFLPQPYELFCVYNREEAIYLEIDEPEAFAELRGEIERTCLAVIDAAAAGGTDLFNFGSVGTELYSPEIFERHLLPSSVAYARRIREIGGFSSFHICGRARTYLDRGYLDELGVDILEGLAGSPAGDLRSLGDARNRLPASTVLRGALDLDFLRTADPESVRRAVVDQLSLAGVGRHIVSGSCDLLYGTPAANIAALARACQGMAMGETTGEASHGA